MEDSLPKKKTTPIPSQETKKANVANVYYT